MERAFRPDAESDLDVDFDAELDAVDELLPSPGRVPRCTEPPSATELARRVLARFGAKLGNGERLPPTLRARFESVLGVDLSDVRLHGDAGAAAAASALGARAFAIGRDVFFDRGELDPASVDGIRLIAHEVVHTVQQRDAAPAFAPAHTRRGEAVEREADDIAARLVRGVPLAQPVRAAPLAIAGEWRRGQPLPEQPDTPNSFTLGQTRGSRRRQPREVRMYHFKGIDHSQSVLLVAGVHGNERAAVEVVDIILDHLRTGLRPRYDLYVIPTLFPDNVASGRRRSPAMRGRPGGRVDPNRNLPREGSDHQLLPENQLLIKAVEQHIQPRPTRIIQVHGTTRRGLAGFSRDVRAGDPAGTAADSELVDEMAARMRELDRQAGRPEDRGVPGNAGGADEWAGGLRRGDSPDEQGASIGQYFGGQGMSVITVETDGNEASHDRGARPDRRQELKDLATVIEELLIGPEARPMTPSPQARTPADTTQAPVQRLVAHDTPRVQLSNNDMDGDAHERHADAVAAAVVRGESAEALLDEYAGVRATGVQRNPRREGRQASAARPAGRREPRTRDGQPIRPGDALIPGTRSRGGPSPDPDTHVTGDGGIARNASQTIGPDGEMVSSGQYAPEEGPHPPLNPYEGGGTDPGPHTPLFDERGPNYDDVQQGDLGDCYLMAALSAVAQMDPERIRRMISPLDDGRYSVTFWVACEENGILTYNPHQEIVTNEVPVVDRLSRIPQFGGTPRADASRPGQRELWVSLVERAYAQWRGSYRAAGNGGWSSVALEEVTGTRSRVFYPNVQDPAMIIAEVERALRDGAPVTAATGSDDELAARHGLFARHAYSVLWAGNGEIVVRNPHSNPTRGGRRIRVNAEVLRACFTEVAISGARSGGEVHESPAIDEGPPSPSPSGQVQMKQERTGETSRAHVPARAPSIAIQRQRGGERQDGPTGLRVRAMERLSNIEWRAEMQTLPESSQNPHPFSGKQIEEDFGPPQRVPGLLMSSDLRPAPGGPRTVEEVLARILVISPNQPTTFTVGANGRFYDYHGGAGFDRMPLDETGTPAWFTPRALERGIGWWCVQRYLYRNRQIAQFRLERRIWLIFGLVSIEVRKTPM